MTGRGYMLGVAFLAACSPGHFEDLRDQAWSDSNGAPDGVTSAHYPVAIAALATGVPGLHFVTAGSDPPAIATTSYEQDGAHTATGIAMADVPAGASPTLAAAIDPVAGSAGLVAAGGLGTGKIQLYDAQSGAEGPVLSETIDASACGGAALDLGRTMVWIRTDLGAPDEPDLVAVAGHDLVVFPDLAPGNPSPLCYRCTIASSGTPQDIAGLAAANILVDTHAELVVAAQDPQGSAISSIPFFHASAIMLDDRGTCFATASSSFLPGQTPDDGTLLVVGDLDNNGYPEVVSTAASTHAVWLERNLTDSGPGGPPLQVGETVTSPTFGASLAIGDLDGNGSAELIVGDPGASPDGKANGAAIVFGSGDQLGLAQRSTLYDGMPSPTHGFGRLLTVGRFVGTSSDTDLLIVGTDDRVFVYFRALVAGVDPRQ